jgi:hypothetical protein
MQAAKAARNQALFREVNERIRNFDYTNPPTEFVCECADPDCINTIRMSLDVYEELRSVSTHFVVAAGKEHFFPEAERIFETHPDYWVVEKFGEAGTEAIRLAAQPRVSEAELL